MIPPPLTLKMKEPPKPRFPSFEVLNFIAVSLFSSLGLLDLGTFFLHSSSSSSELPCEEVDDVKEPESEDFPRIFPVSAAKFVVALSTYSDTIFDDPQAPTVAICLSVAPASARMVAPLLLKEWDVKLKESSCEILRHLVARILGMDSMLW